jgi:thioredoxin 1
LIKKYNSENSDVTILDVDVDSNSELSLEYGIRNVPTIIFKKDDKVVEKVVGAKPLSELVNIIEKHRQS